MRKNRADCSVTSISGFTLIGPHSSFLGIDESPPLSLLVESAFFFPVSGRNRDITASLLMQWALAKVSLTPTQPTGAYKGPSIASLKSYLNEGKNRILNRLSQRHNA